MSNGLLSRKGMIAILASCMFAITACDQNKVDDLESENGQLRSEIEKLVAEKKTAEEQLVSTKAAIDSLQGEIEANRATIDQYQAQAEELEAQIKSQSEQIEQYKNASGTLGELVAQIDEKNEQLNKLEALMVELEAQKVATEETIAAANADREAAKNTRAEADAKLAQAEARLVEIEAEEQRVAELREQVIADQKVVDQATEQWSKVYSEQKLDAVFDRLKSENKMDDKLTFQFSVVAINATAHEVREMRTEINKVVDANSNIYKGDKELKPTARKIQNNLDLIQRRINKGLRQTKPAKFTMNDSYMLQSSGQSIVDLREKLNAWNKDNKAIFVVPRLIEKVSVSLDMVVKADQKARLQDAAKIRTIFSGKLTDPKEYDVDLSKEIDVTVPMQAIISSDNCREFDATCVKSLTSHGLLEADINDGHYETLRMFLFHKLRDSSDQLSADAVELQDGSIQVRGSLGFRGKAASQQCVDQDHYNSTGAIQYIDCTPEAVAIPERKETIETIELRFTVNMIQELPSNGYVPIDLAIENKTKEIASNLGQERRLHIALPIQNERSVVFNAKEAAKKKAKRLGTTGDINDIVRELSAQGDIYRSFVPNIGIVSP